MTHWQDKFERWLKKFFVDEEYNRKMEEYERKQFFLRTIADEGYRYDQDNEWWARSGLQIMKRNLSWKYIKS